MPIVIEEYESDGDGGFYIRWRDPAQDNLVANIHATPELMDEFIANFRTKRQASGKKLRDARDGLKDKQLSDAATVQRFRLAYSEMIEDIIDLDKRGLKHDTPQEIVDEIKAGDLYHENKWLKNPKSGFDEFIAKGKPKGNPNE